MKIYFSSKNIPELANLSMRERQQVLTDAQKKFSAPEKLALNLLKLLMLVPPFLFLARQEWVTLFITIIIVVGVKKAIFTPVLLAFCNKHLQR